jgi:hypothetical protein
VPCSHLPLQVRWTSSHWWWQCWQHERGGTTLSEQAALALPSPLLHLRHDEEGSHWKSLTFVNQPAPVANKLIKKPNLVVHSFPLLEFTFFWE